MPPRRRVNLGPQMDVTDHPHAGLSARARGLDDYDLGLVIDSFVDGLLLTDGNGAVLFCNREALRLTGLRLPRPAECPPSLTEVEPLGSALDLLIRELGPDDRSERRARLELEAGGALRVGARVVFPDRIIVSIREEVARNATPPPIASTKMESPVAVDAVMPHWSEPLALVHLECYLDALSVGIVVVDADGAVAWLNREAMWLLEYDRSFAAAEEMARAARHVAAGRVATPARTRLPLRGGALRLVMWRAGPDMAGVRLHREQPRAGAVTAPAVDGAR